MLRHLFSFRQVVALTLLLALSAFGPPSAMAAKLIKAKDVEGAVALTEEGPSTFVLKGKARDLGPFVAYGEAVFVPGEAEGSLVGVGVAVFKDHNGDLLVGNVSWTVDPAEDDLLDNRVEFRWTDSVELSDGSVVSNTGRFVDDRPPGLKVDKPTADVVIATILYLIFFR